MRRYSYVLLLAGVLLAAASCTRETIMSTDKPSTDKPAVSYDQNTVEEGWIRIKLADDTKALATGAFTRGAVASGMPDIDKVAAELGATEIRVVFPDDPRHTARHRRYGLHLWYDVKIDEAIPVSRAESEFASLESVAYAGPIYKGYLVDNGHATVMSEEEGWTWGGSAAPMPFDDPYLKYQWHYYNDGTLTGVNGEVVAVAGADINVFDVWRNITGGDASIIVAVMDTGVYYEHEDLAANMWVNEAELAGTDDNGYTGDIHGYNFVNMNGTIEPSGHGTHVAGTVAAVNNNGIGVSGVAGGTGNNDGVKIMSCQMLSPEGMGSPGPAAYVYAADNGAVISQNSWNYPSTISQVPADMEVAFDYFRDNAGMEDTDNDGISDVQTGPMAGGIIMFAAGNDYYASNVGVPANDPRVICVAGMLANYARGNYSNCSREYVDIFAPGGSSTTGDPEFTVQGKVYSTYYDYETGEAGYGYLNGTSMATPHVSGVAALMIANHGVGHPGFTKDDLTDILMRSYRNVDDYQVSDIIASGIGVGLIDASLMNLQNPGVAPAAPGGLIVEEGTEEGVLTLVVENLPADGNDMAVSSIHLRYAESGTAEDAEGWTDISIPNRYSASKSLTYECTGLADATDYTFHVSAVDRFGNESETITATGRTIDHINREPELVRPLVRIQLPNGTGEDAFVTTMDLSEYFTDADLPNDELTYAASSSDEEVVKVSLSGSILTVEGFKIGSVIVAVSATDLAGASVSRNMAVEVTEDRGNTENPDPDPEPPVDEGGIELTEGVLNFFPNPAVGETVSIGIVNAGGTTATVTLYDSAAREVLSIAGAEFDTDGENKDVFVLDNIGGLSPGVYTVSVHCSDGRNFSGSFVKA